MQQPPREPSSLLTTSELALVVVEFEGVADLLIAAHVDDGGGHCYGCRLPQTPAPTWPCTLYAVSQQARRLDRIRRLPGRSSGN